MTCTGFFMDGRDLWAYSDGCAYNGYAKRSVVEPKFFSVGDLEISYTSSFRMADILQYQLVLPERKEGIDDKTYIKKYVIEEIRKVLVNCGYTEKVNNTEKGGFFLLYYQGTVYSIQSDFQATIFTGNFFAVGCGEVAMRAAFMALENEKAKQRLTKALEITGKIQEGVSAPYFVKKLR